MKYMFMFDMVFCSLISLNLDFVMSRTNGNESILTNRTAVYYIL